MYLCPVLLECSHAKASVAALAEQTVRAEIALLLKRQTRDLPHAVTDLPVITIVRSAGHGCLGVVQLHRSVLHFVLAVLLNRSFQFCRA